MKSPTKKTYQERMLAVLIHIQNHLDDALDLDELASVAYFSPYHFHRVFRGIVGESVQAHVRRLRMERSAHRLKFSDLPVTKIAFEAGYESHESFTRAFRNMFGHSPSGFRDEHKAMPYGDSDSQVHYSPNAQIESIQMSSQLELAMDVKVETVDPMEVLFMRHVGAYDQVGQTWAKLFAWAGPRGILGPSLVSFGMPHDDPCVTPPERLRYDACMVTDEPIQPEGEIAIQTIAGGRYAVTRHVGPYDQLGDTYAQLCGQWFPSSGCELRSAPALEFYRNTPMETSPEQLITDIFMPMED